MVHMVQKWDNIEYEIILLLLKNETHLREMARALGEPHSTIVRKLDWLKKENVLDYRREGKNKIFFIKNNLQAKSYVFNAERYKMIKLLKKYPELSVIIAGILKKTKEKMIILFGSYAKFMAKEDSDIDIYIETTDKNVKKEIESINSKINVKIGKFSIEDLLIKEIIKNHVIVKDIEEFYEKRRFFQ